MHSLARMLLVGTLAVLAFRLAGSACPTPAPRAPEHTGRVVFLARQLDDADLIALAAAAGPRGVLLLDTPEDSGINRAFLAAYRPEVVLPVGNYPGGVEDIKRRLGVTCRTPVASPDDLWNRILLPTSAIIVPSRPRRLLLQAACLAAARRQPLLLADGRTDLAQRLKRWGVRRATLVGYTNQRLPGVRLESLPNERAVTLAHLNTLTATGAVETAVVCNPEDGHNALSALAPWIAARKNAALILTDVQVERGIRKAIRRPALARLDTLILLGDMKALPVVRRPNPIPGDKDKEIEMEPMTPVGDEPVSFSVGRLHHSRRAVVPLMLARSLLMTGHGKALVASNPGGGLPLLEAFSRQNAQTLASAGYDVTGLYGKQVTGTKLRALLPRFDVFLWEGHHNTLVKDWGFVSWDEPLPPSFIFLQSCLALQDEKVHPLFSRGAIAVAGTSTRTYSASGGAFSLAFMQALLHEGQTLGGSLRQAKNFLSAWAQLKQKRLGQSASKTGANVRAAWAFSLWGDPTLSLPAPTRNVVSLPRVRHELNGTTLTIRVPEQRQPAVTSGRYRVSVPAGARLAGVVRTDGGDAALVPLVFIEVPLPRLPSGHVPRWRSKIPASRWVFTWDRRRQVGYLLVLTRPADGRELQFRLDSKCITVAVGKDEDEG